MKNIAFVLIIVAFFSCTSNQSKEQITDLTSSWDTVRALENPDKGWYHHMLDNGVHKYLLQDENDLENFPGMDHLYLRLAWAYLEPEEGNFDWSYIDDIVEKYVPMGYKISFRISSKETGPAPTSVPLEIDGVRYATPYWVKQAGAKGIGHPEYGSASWTPDWDDPIYLEKLDNFYKAFAEKYDGMDYVRYMDVGSIGEWGEGHTYFSTRIPPTVEEIKTHMDIFLKHFKNTQLIVTDDLLAYDKSEEDVDALLAYALENGFGMRDDSPLVQGYMENDLGTWTVRTPRLFEATWRKYPTVFELEHYSKVKANGYWLEENGVGIIPEYKLSGAKVFREAMKLIHPTYVGYHGYMGEWLSDNPDLTVELLNRCGYWYFPKSIKTAEFSKGKFTFEIEWLNKGLAPAYNTYQLKGKLIPQDGTEEAISFAIKDSGNTNWMPNKLANKKYEVELPKPARGEYRFAIQLFDTESEMPVELALKTDLMENGFFVVQTLTF